MIPRYSRKILKEIWEDNNKFQIWLDLEILACEAMEKLGQIPKGTSSKIKKKAKWEFIKTDLTNQDKLLEIFTTFHPDIVVNLAAQAGVRYSIEKH